MLAGGVAATTALVLWAGYPASMVGVNGAGISNLIPPTLAVVTFGIAQAGLALLLREPLARLMRRPLAWAAVATANLSAMTLFLWHQTAFLAVTMAALLAGRLPGLHTAPDTALWVGERIAWPVPGRSPGGRPCSISAVKTSPTRVPSESTSSSPNAKRRFVRWYGTVIPTATENGAGA